MGNVAGAPAADLDAIKKRRAIRQQSMKVGGAAVAAAVSEAEQEEADAKIKEEEEAERAEAEAEKELAAEAAERDAAAAAAKEAEKEEKPGFIYGMSQRVCSPFFGSFKTDDTPTADVLNDGSNDKTGNAEEASSPAAAAAAAADKVAQPPGHAAHKLAGKRKKWLVCIGDDARMNASVFKWICSEYNSATEQITIYTVVPTIREVIHDLKIEDGTEASFQAELEKVSRERLGAFAMALQKSGIKANTEFSQGDAKTKIIEEVEKRQIDLLVLGRHPMPENQSERILAWLGSVSEYCSRNAQCATVVVKG